MWGLFAFFFFNDTATTEIYTLSLHDALPIFDATPLARAGGHHCTEPTRPAGDRPGLPLRSGGPAAKDRKSTRLNSSHANISYAVFCLKKKKPVRACTQSQHEAAGLGGAGVCD